MVVAEGDLSEDPSDHAKRTLTYISVARRIVTFLIMVIAIGVVFTQFKGLENLGISLVASAGVATVILGIAAQATLGNIFAGLQIALTRPARIGDIIIYEGEYGSIENIW